MCRCAGLAALSRLSDGVFPGQILPENTVKKAAVIFGKRRNFSGSGGYSGLSGGFLKLFFDLKKFTCFAFSYTVNKPYL